MAGRNNHTTLNNDPNQTISVAAISAAATVAIFFGLFALIAYYVHKKYKKPSGQDRSISNGPIQEEGQTKKEEEEGVASQGPSRPDIVAHVSSEHAYDFRDRTVTNLIPRVTKALNSGTSSAAINPKMTLNEQVHVIPYVPKLEMSREYFNIQTMLGSGNFGTVLKGETTGLFYPGSKTTVAIKTINDKSRKDDVDSLLCEIKILSNLNLHCNLVSMIGACTSDASITGEFWLLLEFCKNGDLKTFMTKNIYRRPNS